MDIALLVELKLALEDWRQGQLPLGVLTVRQLKKFMNDKNTDKF
jgi:hypothetical protein